MHCLTVTYPAPGDTDKFKACFTAGVPNYSVLGATLFHFPAGA
jgi:hypothetical protein